MHKPLQAFVELRSVSIGGLFYLASVPSPITRVGCHRPARPLHVLPFPRDPVQNPKFHYLFASEFVMRPAKRIYAAAVETPSRSVNVSTKCIPAASSGLYPTRWRSFVDHRHTPSRPSFVDHRRTPSRHPCPIIGATIVDLIDCLQFPIAFSPLTPLVAEDYITLRASLIGALPRSPNTSSA
jgi:hypothetical protein